MNLGNGERGFIGGVSGFGGGVGMIDIIRNGKGSYFDNNGMNNNFFGGWGLFNFNGKGGGGLFFVNGNGGLGDFNGGLGGFDGG